MAAALNNVAGPPPNAVAEDLTRRTTRKPAQVPLISDIRACWFQALSRRISPQSLGLLLVSITYAIAAALTWRKWGDPLIDYGLQLYLPWRISTGSVLYRDVTYLTGGPFSQYYHALIFKVFGVSLSTLIASNLAIGLGLLVLLYRRFLACSDVWTAATISLGVVLVFAFNQFSDIGNYNFITPYSPEVWHGVALSILAVSLLSRWLESGKGWFVSAAGFCAGLVFMTKPDVFAALMLAFAAAFLLTSKGQGIGPSFKFLVAALSAALLPVCAFLLYFHQFQTWAASARSVAFAWVPLLNSSVSNQVFYKWCAGLDVPRYHLRMMLIHSLVICAVVGLCAVWFRHKLDTSPKRVFTVGLVALLIALATGVDWVDCGRSLPVLTLTLCILLIAHRSSKFGAWSLELGAFPLLWSLFAFGALAKLGLYSRIWHYGFALAMPAFAGAIYFLLWLMPGILEKYAVQRRPFRITIGLLLFVGFMRLFIQSELLCQGKTVTVGRGHDQMLAFNEKLNPAGSAIRSALEWMEKNADPRATLVALPEGIMVNYLSRRVNPTRYLAWNPAELAMFGQENMLSDFRQHCPDYVMLIHRDTSEFGVKLFGQEQKFGLELMQWIGQNYEPACLIGHEPLRNSLFGIKILKRSSVMSSGRRDEALTFSQNDN